MQWEYSWSKDKLQASELAAVVVGAAIPYGGFEKFGGPFGGPHQKEYSILEFISGSLISIFASVCCRVRVGP